MVLDLSDKCPYAFLRNGRFMYSFAKIECFSFLYDFCFARLSALILIPGVLILVILILAVKSPGDLSEFCTFQVPE